MWRLCSANNLEVSHGVSCSAAKPIKLKMRSEKTAELYMSTAWCTIIPVYCW